VVPDQVHHVLGGGTREAQPAQEGIGQAGADDVMVMYLGRPVEQGTKETVFTRARHPYTQVLLAATPSVDPKARSKRMTVKGELPSPVDLPSGCRFRTRCPEAFDRCAQVDPKLVRVGPDHEAACLLYE